MAGTIRKAIDEIIDHRSHGNSAIAATTRTKLIIKGINPDLYKDDSADDETILEKVKQIAKDLDVKLSI